MDFAFVSASKSAAIGRVMLNRPEQRNAQNKEMLRELDHAVRAYDRDPEVRVIVIGGYGKHFSAGHDLKQAQAERADFDATERWRFEKEFYYDICLTIRNSSKPTIAQVQGACIAAGFMVANMCDLIVATDNAYFADPVVQSLAASAVEVLVHPWVMSQRRAMEFLLTGEPMTAQEALRIGMVNRVVAPDRLEAEVDALATKIAAADPFAAMLTKRSLNRSRDISGFTNALEAHFESHQLSHFAPGMQSRTRSDASGAVRDGKTLTATASQGETGTARR